MIQPRYVARVERGDRWWVAHVPEVRVHTQARRLDQIEDMVRDAIGLLLEMPADSFDVEIKIELPDDLEEAVAPARAARSRAEAVMDEANELTRASILRLLDRGLPVRDIGRLLGLSFQRVSQVARTAGVSSH